MDAIQQISPVVKFHLYTTVPEWFFADSWVQDWTYHHYVTDIGMVQKTALREDIDATLAQLARFIPFPAGHITPLVDELNALSVNLILCDISPLGLQVAAQAGIPSVLIENFTWDWIYSGYPDTADYFMPFVDYLRDRFALADVHIRAAPYCDETRADLLAAPVSRRPRDKPGEMRNRLGIAPGQQAVLITMGGIADRWDFSALSRRYPRTVFVIPAGAERELRIANILYLPHHHSYYHPDLVAACDAVIGKVGYSTIAETYWAGIPFGYISRPRFRESAELTKFIRATMPGLEISQEEFERGEWQEYIGDLLQLQPVRHAGQNGADQIAEYLTGRGFIA